MKTYRPLIRREFDGSFYLAGRGANKGVSVAAGTPERAVELLSERDAWPQPVVAFNIFAQDEYVGVRDADDNSFIFQRHVEAVPARSRVTLDLGALDRCFEIGDIFFGVGYDVISVDRTPPADRVTYTQIGV